MKKSIILLLILTMMLVFASCKKEANVKSLPSSTTEVSSVEDLPAKFYWLNGYSYANMFASYYEDFDPLAFAQGFIDFYNSNERFSSDEQQKIYSEYMYGGNLEEAEAFLAENKKAEGVVTTKSGLQYKVITAGNGEKPASSDTVNIDYTLTLLDGTVADQGKGIEFPLSNLISGMIEGITCMDVGSTYRLWIHPELGYGTNEAGSIPGNSLLIFDVTLNAIVK